MKILVLRADRLGDLIVSLPVFQYLANELPHAEIIGGIQKKWLPVVKRISYVSDWITFEPQELRWTNLIALTGRLRSMKLDCAIVLQDHPVISLAIKLAGVPKRVGPLSKIGSYFYFNLGLRQHRSESLQHEASYGLELAGQALGKSFHPDLLKWRPAIKLLDEDVQWGREWIQKNNLKPHDFIVVHPGMGGSAKNWKKESYLVLCAELKKRNIPFIVALGPEVINGTPGGDGHEYHAFLCYQAKPDASIGKLGALMSFSAGVMAPSTGPLHMASALGVPTVSIYSPIRVQHKRRWGPLGVQDLVFAPDVQCPAQFECLGEKCKVFDCMDQIGVSSVLEVISRWPMGSAGSDKR